MQLAANSLAPTELQCQKPLPPWPAPARRGRRWKGREGVTGRGGCEANPDPHWSLREMVVSRLLNPLAELFATEQWSRGHTIGKATTLLHLHPSLHLFGDWGSRDQSVGSDERLLSQKSEWVYAWGWHLGIPRRRKEAWEWMNL